MTAFEKYILSLHRPAAVRHVFDCLMGMGKEAWEFMDKYQGADWACPADELCQTIDNAINNLEERELERGQAN